MGICTRRTFLLTICSVQLVSTIERQIFDFLGFMWTPILANFFNIIFVIFGFFGTFQYRPKYIITYSVWSTLWLGWNIFIICFYLDIGILDKNNDVLNMGTGSVSWWEINGIGCKAIYPTNLTSDDPFRPLRPEFVTGCLLEYQYVEVLHAGFQCILAVFGTVGGISLSHVFLEEDDSLQAKQIGKRKMSCRKSLYSIEYSSHNNSCVGNDAMEYSVENGASGSFQLPAPHLSPRPMTPRRVKRRSVISRGSSGRNSLPLTYSEKRNSVRYTSSRSSLRASGRRISKVPHTSPVSRLIEQQHTLQHRQMFEAPEASESQRIATIDPASSHSDLLVPKATSSPWKVPTGHTNPLYQQNSSQSLQEDEDPCNNRPSSARSSYSNYHGTRPMSCYLPGGGLPYYISTQAAGQVPVVNSLQNTNKNVLRSRPNPTFFNSGPPAYEAEGGVGSETVI